MCCHLILKVDPQIQPYLILQENVKLILDFLTSKTVLYIFYTLNINKIIL